MSLWDTDKTDGMRIKPKPNASDLVNNRMSHGTTGFTLKQDNDENIAYLAIKDGRFQIYRADGTLLGQGGVRENDQDGALDVAKPGEELT